MKWHGIRGAVFIVKKPPSHAEITLLCCVPGIRSNKRREPDILLSFHHIPIDHQLNKMMDGEDLARCISRFSPSIIWPDEPPDIHYLLS